MNEFVKGIKSLSLNWCKLEQGWELRPWMVHILNLLRDQFYSLLNSLPMLIVNISRCAVTKWFLSVGRRWSSSKFWEVISSWFVILILVHKLLLDYWLTVETPGMVDTELISRLISIAFQLCWYHPCRLLLSYQLTRIGTLHLNGQVSIEFRHPRRPKLRFVIL